MSLNCQSIVQITQGVLEYLESNAIDIAILQETWLKKGDKSVSSKIREYGYEIIKTSRQSETNGGGLAVLYKSHITVKNFSSEFFSYGFKTFEFICCNIEVDGGVIKLANIYRLGYSNKHRYTPLMFLEEFDSFLQHYLTLPGHNLLCGDFNFHVEKTSDYYAKRFIDLLSMYNLQQHVDARTHKKNGTLDLVIDENQAVSSIQDVFVDEVFDLSDHFPVCFTVPCHVEPPSNKSVTVSTRNVHNLNLDDFRNDLRDSDVCCPAKYSHLTSDASVILYNETLSSLFDKHCPLTEKKYQNRHAKSRWFTKSLSILKRNKRQAERRFRKHPTDQNYESYRSLRNEYNHKLKITREDHFKKAITDAIKDMKPLYKTVNKLTGKTEPRIYPTFDTEQNIANGMTKYYCDKIKGIRDDIKRYNDTESLNRKPEVPFNGTSLLQNFSQVTPEKFSEIISQMNSKTSVLDPVPTSIVKQCLDLLAPIILHITNKSIVLENFPQSLKHASVSPICKDKKRQYSEI